MKLTATFKQTGVDVTVVIKATACRRAPTRFKFTRASLCDDPTRGPSGMANAATASEVPTAPLPATPRRARLSPTRVQVAIRRSTGPSAITTR